MSDTSTEATPAAWWQATVATCAQFYNFLLNSSVNYQLLGLYLLASVPVFLILRYLYQFFFKPYVFILPEQKYNRKDRPNRLVGKVPPFYPNGWFKICDSFELPRGAHKYVHQCGQHLIAFRGSVDGKVGCVDAYCPHLGANMGQGARVVGDCIECPFHGWLFDKQGKCEYIPYTDKVPDVAKVKQYPCVEVNGMILMYHHADQEETPDMTPQWMPPRIDAIENGDFVLHGKFQTFVKCHVQEIPENGADAAHLNVLHAPVAPTCLPTFATHLWNAQWQTSKEPNCEHMSSISLDQCLRLGGKTVPLTNVHGDINQVGPGIVNLKLTASFGTYYVIETVTPYGPMLQNVEHVVYGKNTVFSRIFAKILLTAFCGQFSRDIIVWNNKTYAHKPLLVKNDGPIAQFRRWYAQFYSENSKRQDLDEQLKW